jgi:hypothetical protein
VEGETRHFETLDDLLRAHSPQWNAKTQDILHRRLQELYDIQVVIYSTVHFPKRKDEICYRLSKRMRTHNSTLVAILVEVVATTALFPLKPFNFPLNVESQLEPNLVPPSPPTSSNSRSLYHTTGFDVFPELLALLPIGSLS